MRAEQRLNRIEQQLLPDAPCTCKALLVTQEGRCEVVRLPACPQHKRREDVEVLRLRGVSLADV